MNDQQGENQPNSPEITAQTLPSDNGKRFEELFAGQEDIIFKFVSASLQDGDAEDLYQDAVIQGIEKIHQLEHPRRFLSWMYKVVKSTLLDYWDKTGKDNDYRQSLEDGNTLINEASMRHNPEKISLDQEQKLKFDEAMNALDEESHLVLTLRFTERMSYKEIADIMQLDVDGVKYRLGKAKDVVRRHMKHYFLGCLMVSFDHDHILALSQQAFEKAMIRHPELLAFGAATTVGTTGAAASGSTGASVSSGVTWTGILATVAFPFLWVVSLFLTGHVYGTRLIFGARTLPLRLWLIRHLLYCYSTAFVFATGYVTTCILLTSMVGLERRHVVVAVSGVTLLAVFIGQLLWVALRYKRLQNLKDNNAGTDESVASKEWKNIHSSVRCIFICTSIALALFLVFLYSQIALPHVRHTILSGREMIAYASMIIASAFMLIPVIFHIGSYCLFRYCLLVSQNETEFQKTYRPLSPDTLSSWRSHRIALFLIGAMMLLPSLHQLLVAHKRPVYAAVEFAAFALSWYWVYRKNQHTTYQGGWWRIFAMAVIQFLILNLLLQTIYE